MHEHSEAFFCIIQSRLDIFPVMTLKNGLTAAETGRWASEINLAARKSIRDSLFCSSEALGNADILTHLLELRTKEFDHVCELVSRHRPIIVATLMHWLRADLPGASQADPTPAIVDPNLRRYIQGRLEECDSTKPPIRVKYLLEGVLAVRQGWMGRIASVNSILDALLSSETHPCPPTVSHQSPVPVHSADFRAGRMVRESGIPDAPDNQAKLKKSQAVTKEVADRMQEERDSANRTEAALVERGITDRLQWRLNRLRSRGYGPRERQEPHYRVRGTPAVDTPDESSFIEDPVSKATTPFELVETDEAWEIVNDDSCQMEPPTINPDDEPVCHIPAQNAPTRPPCCPESSAPIPAVPPLAADPALPDPCASEEVPWEVTAYWEVARLDSLIAVMNRASLFSSLPDLLDRIHTVSLLHCSETAHGICVAVDGFLSRRSQGSLIDALTDSLLSESLVKITASPSFVELPTFNVYQLLDGIELSLISSVPEFLEDFPVLYKNEDILRLLVATEDAHYSLSACWKSLAKWHSRAVHSLWWTVNAYVSSLRDYLVLKAVRVNAVRGLEAIKNSDSFFSQVTEYETLIACIRRDMFLNPSTAGVLSQVVVVMRTAVEFRGVVDRCERFDMEEAVVLSQLEPLMRTFEFATAFLRKNLKAEVWNFI